MPGISRFADNYVPKIVCFVHERNRWIIWLLLIAGYCLFYGGLIDELIVAKIGKLLVVRSYWLTDVLFLAIFGFSLLSIVSQRYLGKKIKNRWVFLYYPTLVTVGYLLPRLGVLKTASAQFSEFSFSPHFVYADAIYFLVLRFLVKLNLRKGLAGTEARPGIPDVMEDDLYRIQGIDILRRTPYAEFIGEIISKKQTSAAFAIALKGRWGSGKSVFLRQVNASLSGVIKIEFNPWMSKGVDTIIPDFFRMLVSETMEYDGNLSRRFEKYSEALVRMDEKFAEKMFSAFGLLKKNIKEE